ncbi:hypothetical protein BGZ65_012478 [Modicella reniformis]|uniref:Uncharacterized protein n=1 Tax=Modicella reniformis TaxID=1440133 RepID=A0A9P6MCH6_9FUNG|nr:hypothetical protein BGZ65_012478 [Modicella reniformis]
MSLDYEAMYVVKSLGAFELPLNNLQLGLLCPGLGLLQLVHQTVSRTLDAIKNRDSENTGKEEWLRPSYYVKENRIPTPKVVIEDMCDIQSE